MDQYRNLANSGQDSRTNHVKIDTVVVLVLIESTKTTTTAVITLAWTPKICLECLLSCNQSQASSSHHRNHGQRTVSCHRTSYFRFVWGCLIGNLKHRCSPRSVLRTASSTSFDFRKKYFISQRDATTTRFPRNDISDEDHKKWTVVMFSSLLRRRFLDVRQRSRQRNGCLNPNHIPFPLFREHEVISKFTNHASPFVTERTNHVTVIYHSVKFPAEVARHRRDSLWVKLPKK